VFRPDVWKIWAHRRSRKRRDGRIEIAVQIENWKADGSPDDIVALNGSDGFLAPLDGRTSIELAAFTPQATLEFQDAMSGKTVRLTLSQSIERRSLVLLGHYSASSFDLTSDGHGGSPRNYDSWSPRSRPRGSEAPQARWRPV